MKIISIINSFSNSFANIKILENEKVLYSVLPDNTLLRNNRPFFYPDFTDNINFSFGYIIKIGKVGKGILEKFASKYIDSIAVAVNFIASDILKECIDNNLPWDKALNFDSALGISNFTTQIDYKNLDNHNLEINLNNNILSYNKTNNINLSLESIISQISDNMTLKIGDLIYLPENFFDIKINIEDEIIVKYNNELSLKARIM